MTLVAIPATLAILSLPSTSRATLINHWAFDETSGTVADDTGSLNKDGTIQVAAGVTINQPGKIGTAFSFDGTNNAEVRITGYKGITARAARTTSVWVKTPTAQNGRGMYSWGTDTGAQAWDVVLDNSSKHRLNVNGGNRRGATNLNNNAWHLATMTWSNDGSPNVNDTRIYVDGAVDTPYTTLAKNLNTGSNLDVFIGVGRKRGDGANQEFIGLLDDVAFWNEVLTANEIKSLFDVGDDATLAYDAGKFDQLKQINDAGSGSVTIDGLEWTYATGLTDPAGLTVDGNNLTLVLNASADTGLTAVIPEPSTFALAALGLLGLLGWGRRRRFWILDLGFRILDDR